MLEVVFTEVIQLQICFRKRKNVSIKHIEKHFCLLFKSEPFETGKRFLTPPPAKVALFSYDMEKLTGCMACYLSKELTLRKDQFQRTCRKGGSTRTLHVWGRPLCEYRLELLFRTATFDSGTNAGRQQLWLKAMEAITLKEPACFGSSALLWRSDISL